MTDRKVMQVLFTFDTVQDNINVDSGHFQIDILACFSSNENVLQRLCTSSTRIDVNLRV